MKKNKLNVLMLALLFALFITSCTKKETKLIDFETVQLGTDGYVNDRSIEIEDLSFNNTYTVSEWGDSWNGFAFSNKTDKTTSGTANQFSVYGNGGADNSEKFAVIYDAGSYGIPVCTFTNDAEYEVESFKVTNATYAALVIKNGDSGFGIDKFSEDDWFKLIVTGKDKTGNPTGTVEFYLADYRNGKSIVVDSWETVNLKSLGKVNSLEFTFDSSDFSVYNGEKFINIPAYACVDNLIYIIQE